MASPVLLKDGKIPKWLLAALAVTAGLSAVVIMFFGGMFILAWFWINHEKPYDESNPTRIVNAIEKDFGFRLPEEKHFLKAGDTISAGVDHPYVIIARFLTDSNGLTELKKNIEFEDVTEQIAKNEWTDGRLFTKTTPAWYKSPLEKGRVWEGYLLHNKRHLQVLCIQVDAENAIIYLDCWGGSTRQSSDH